MVAITIRNVPDEVRNELAVRAARSGRSLQEYLSALLIEIATRRTQEDVLSEARARTAALGTRVSAADIIAARDADRR